MQRQNYQKRNERCNILPTKALYNIHFINNKHQSKLICKVYRILFDDTCNTA